MTFSLQNLKPAKRLRKQFTTRNGSPNKAPPTWQHLVTGLTDLRSPSVIGWPGNAPTPTLESSTALPASSARTLINSDPVAWIQEHFYIPETRGALTLAPYQITALRELLAHDDHGIYRYSTMLWSDIKKSAKSTIAAAVALWRAFQIDADGWGSIYIVANDLKQADSRVAYYLRRAIQLNPTIRDRCTIRTYKITLPNHTTIEAIPIDPTGEAGSNADLVVFSELWGAASKAHQQMWTEMTTPPTKFGRSFRWIETYAGITGKAPILEQLYDTAVKPETRLDSDLELYAVERLGVLWNTRPRLAWQTDDYYQQQAQDLLPHEFQRVHRNQWSSVNSAAYLSSMTLWDSLAEPLPALANREPLILACDAGDTDDTFAIVAIGGHPDDRQRRAVRAAWCYVPQGGQPLNQPQILADLQAFCDRHRVVQVCYDKYQLRMMMQSLKGVWTEEFSQATARLEADKALLDAIQQGTIAHDGTLTDLRQHLANADRQLDSNGRLRIVKRTQALKIDLAVALSMAHHRSQEFTL